jgi:hypothetical protein
MLFFQYICILIINTIHNNFFHYIRYKNDNNFYIYVIWYMTFVHFLMQSF